MNKTVTSGITIDDLKNVIHRFDLLQRPHICFIHPDVLEEIKKIEPNIEDQILFRATELVDKDKCVVMKREDLEEWGSVGLSKNFGGDIR